MRSTALRITAASIAAASIAAALALAAPAQATTYVLDFTPGATIDGAGTNGAVIRQTFGDNADVDITYIPRVGPGASALSTGAVQYWSTGYGDLTGVAWSSSIAAELSFSLLTPGKILSIESLRLGGWPNFDRQTSVRIYDPDYNLLYTSGAIAASGSANTLVEPAVSRAGSLILQFGPDSISTGIDLITYSVVDAPIIPSGVPEPASAALLLAGLLGLRAARRR